jgi:hypothetical protein
MEIFLLREEYHKNRRHLLAALGEINAEKTRTTFHLHLIGFGCL